MKKRFVVCYSDNIPKEKEMHFIQFIKIINWGGGIGLVICGCW